MDVKLIFPETNILNIQDMSHDKPCLKPRQIYVFYYGV